MKRVTYTVISDTVCLYRLWDEMFQVQGFSRNCVSLFYYLTLEDRKNITQKGKRRNIFDCNKFNFNIFIKNINEIANAYSLSRLSSFFLKHVINSS